MVFAFIAAGILLLALGSEAVLRGGVGASRALGVSPLLIGLLVISAGTSAPELVVTLDATLQGAPGLGLGNIIGSNIANLLLILGVGGLIRPMPIAPKLVLRDGVAMLLATLALVVLAGRGWIGRNDGLVMLAGFFIYAIVCFITDWRRPGLQCVGEARAQLRSERLPSGTSSMLLLILGLVLLVLGGVWVTDGGIALAHHFGVPDAIIGLTVVALGTSLPELATTAVAAARGQSGIAVGDLIGSNIFNILIVVGVTAVIHPIVISAALSSVDAIVLLASAVLVPLLLMLHWRLTRLQGLFLIICYLGYIGYLGWQQGLLMPDMMGRM